MYTKEKMDFKMKKLISTILLTTSISTLSLQASSKVEVITNETNSVKMNDKKREISEEECKKHLGVDNYNFLNQVYNDKNTVMLKCKEEFNK
jgi:hypothetical protein